jgi:hypothetical protein
MSWITMVYGTFSSSSASDCPEGPVNLVGNTFILLDNHEQYLTSHWWKVFAGGFVLLLVWVHLCQDLVAVAVDNTVSSI